MKSLGWMLLGSSASVALAAPSIAQQKAPETDQSIGVSAAASSDVAAAQPTTGKPMENAPGEIIVTAQKRAERLQDIPVNVSVANPEMLRAKSVQQFEDLGKVAPSFSSTTATGNTHAVLSMRGIYTSSLSIGVPSAVAVMVDDIAQAPEARGYNQLVDVDRVEVLAGPQPTIAGRNAAAGLVNIVTRGPSDHFQADVGGTLTTDSEQRASVFVAGPIAPTLSASLSGNYDNYRGNIKNITDGDHAGTKTYGVRGKVRWQPSDRVDVTATGYYQRIKENAGAGLYEYLGSGAELFGFLPPSAALGSIASTLSTNNASNNKIATNAQNYYNTKSFGGILNGRVSLGHLDLISITGYEKETNKHLEDLLGILVAPIPGFDNTDHSNGKVTTTSQEFRLVSPASDRFSYVLGLYYLDQKSALDFTRVVLAPFDRDRHAELQNLAAYARGTYKLTDKINLIGGVRYNHEKVSYHLFDRPTETAQSNSAKDGVVLGDVSAEYHFNRNMMVYGRYARGYQGQSFDLEANYTPGVLYQPVKPEQVDSWEIGTKGEYFDRRLTVNFDLFTATYRNFQAEQSITNFDTIATQLLNVGTVVTKGVEGQFSYRPTALTTVDFSGAYVHPEIKSYANAGCYTTQTVAQGCVNGTQDLSGKRLAGSPAWRLTGSIEQHIPVGGLPFDVSLRADVTYQTKTNFDVRLNPYTVQNGYALLNLSANFADLNKRAKLSVFVNNVTNKHFVYTLSDRGDFWGGVHAIQAAGLPRDWGRYAGVRLSYHFD